MRQRGSRIGDLDEGRAGIGRLALGDNHRRSLRRRFAGMLEAIVPRAGERKENVARLNLPAVAGDSSDLARSKRIICVLQIEDVAKPNHSRAAYSLLTLSASAPYPRRAMMGNG